MQVEIRNLSKSFSSISVLDQVDLTVREGSLCALLGPSGSGKTTLLRIIAGLEFPDGGRVEFDGRDVLKRNTKDRQVGFVFQHYALFRHMTVLQNIEFGPKLRPRLQREPATQIRRRASELLDLVQLTGFEGRYPEQLSGGQRQRVALARALAIEPKILLLDEPFGALDARVRKEMRRWLRELQRRIGLTSIFVTHDQEEALEMADDVAVMEHGHILQFGPPQEVYDHPVSPAVYDFFGGANVLPCRVQDGRVWIDGQALADLRAPNDNSAKAYFRAHDVEILPTPGADALRASITDIQLNGGLASLSLSTHGNTLSAEVSRWLLERLGARKGDVVGVRPRRLGLFGPVAGSHPVVR